MKVHPLIFVVGSLSACVTTSGPATPNSASAKLAARAALLADRTAEIASRSADLGGAFDQLRSSPNGEHAAELAHIRAESAELLEAAIAIEAEAKAIGASAQVY